MTFFADLWSEFGFLERKKSAVTTGPETAFVGLGAPKWTQRNYRRLAEEGYRRNVIAHRSVKLLAESAAAVPWRIGRGDRVLRGHPVLDLLARPNPLMSGQDLMEHVYAHLNIAGDAYIEMVPGADGRPGELYVLRPDRMTVVPGPNGWPRAYRHEVGGRVHEFPVDAVSGESAILHLKFFHPLDDQYGMPPLEAAAYAIDIHNAGSQWNKALFDNAARPSGALVYDSKDGGVLSEAQFERLKSDLAETYQGARNAGRPMLLEGGLKWQPMAFSPQDMEFAEGKNMAAREIALAFGVPPLLLNIPGDNTYSNYQEANRALWRLTILPLMEKLTAALNSGLVPAFGRDLWLDFDRDSIGALQAERTAALERLAAADFMTINEKRVAAGLEPLPDGDRFV